MTDEISTLLDLMSKSKINFLIALIVGGEQVVLPLLLSPATPNLFPPPILPDIIPLGQPVQSQIHATYANQNLVPSVIIWCIVRAVNI